MTKSRKPDYSKIDIDKLLKSRRQVAVIWSTEDIREMRPDLNDNQAWKVLKACRANHQFEFGFNRSLIDMTASEMFPQPEDDTNDEGE